MSRLGSVNAFRRIPPKRRLRASFRPRPCISAEHGDIPAEASCLQAACRRKSIRTLRKGHLHGKERVDGLSPSEGLDRLQMSPYCCLSVEPADTFRTRLRYARRIATRSTLNVAQVL